MEAENHPKASSPLGYASHLQNICGILCHTSDHPLSLSAQSMQPFENTAPVELLKMKFP